MRQSLIDFGGLNLSYSIGSAAVMESLQKAPAKKPFDDVMLSFLETVSKMLLKDGEAKRFSDVVTLGFWMRKASVIQLKDRFASGNNADILLGRGVAFHIAPSNVPVNYAYSLVTGLICGNKNIVRIPSKDFEQVRIVNRAFQGALREMPEMAPYICLVKYGHDSAINDALSAIADVRIVWGGDNTISELRKSSLKPRAAEITFADRYSLAVIDSDAYMKIEDKARTANDFYNDTYLTDQNACTSPRAVIWMGSRIPEAKDIFWNHLKQVLAAEYELSGVQSVNKLTSAYLLAAAKDGVQKMPWEDNLIVRMKVPHLTADLMDFKDNSGFFIEYDCSDIMELYDLCDDPGCQTVSYIGDKEMFRPLIMRGISGIDRIVPVGKTMDFDLIWDGYNLFERMTRIVALV